MGVSGPLSWVDGGGGALFWVGGGEWVGVGGDECEKIEVGGSGWGWVHSLIILYYICEKIPAKAH